MEGRRNAEEYQPYSGNFGQVHHIDRGTAGHGLTSTPAHAYTWGMSEEGISPKGHDYTELSTGCVLVLPKGQPKHAAITVLTEVMRDPFLGTYAKLAPPCIPVIVQGDTLGELVDAAMTLRAEEAYLRSKG